jgi:ankyrin repeat protein
MSPGWGRLGGAVGRSRRKVAWQATLLLLIIGSPSVSFGTSTQLPLWRAAQRGDVEMVRLALAQEPDAQAKNSALWSAIQSAPNHPTESKQIIVLLLEHGADVNAKLKDYGHRPIYLAGNPEELRLLLDIGADVSGDSSDGGVAARIACNRTTKDPARMLTLLLDHGAQIANSTEGGYSVLQCAVITHRLNLEEFLLVHGVSPDFRGGLGDTALFDAPDPATIEPLLRHGADINATNSHHATALVAAIAENRVSKSLFLLARGANVNVTVGNKVTVLELAAARGQLEVVQELVAKGADVNTREPTGATALHAAVHTDQIAVANFLLSHGADVNAKGEYGWSPLHYAADGNSVAMVSLLLSHHADITARNVLDFPPDRLATSEDVLALFARAGAPVAPQSLAEVDAAACEEVVRSGRWKEVLNGNAASELLSFPQDPRDNWDFQDSGLVSQEIREQVVRIQDQDYILGVWASEPHANVFLDEPLPPEHPLLVQRDMSRLKHRTGPAYLVRRGTNGVASVVCEFKNTRELWFEIHRVMTPLELLKVRARRESITVSQAAVKMAGLWGAQALLEASLRRPPEVGSLSSDSDGSALGDAIEAHRDDILRFYLDHGVSPDLKRRKHLLFYIHILFADSNVMQRPQWYDDPLFTAIASGTVDSVALLLEHGASPDAVGSPNPIATIDTVTPLRVLARAVINGQLVWVKTLLEHGADPNLGESSQAVFVTLSGIVGQGPLADEQAAGIYELFLHGADPNPFISAALEAYARDKDRKDLRYLVENSQGNPIETQWVKEAIASSGSASGPGEVLLADALAFRDAPDCDPKAPATPLAICLPNTLKHADTAARLARRNHLRAQLDRKCNLHLAGPHTHAGWLSYVLSDQSRVLCVLDELRQQEPTRKPAP